MLKVCLLVTWWRSVRKKPRRGGGEVEKSLGEPSLTRLSLLPFTYHAVSHHRHHNQPPRQHSRTLMNAASEGEGNQRDQSKRRARPPHDGEVRMMNGASSSSQAAQAPGQAAPLLAIIYSEFDNTLGPTIRCQAPQGYVCWVCVYFPGCLLGPPLACASSHASPSHHPPTHSFLSQEFFDSISDYVITGRQLYGRTIAVTASDLQVVGFPLCIENEKVRPCPCVRRTLPPSSLHYPLIFYSLSTHPTLTVRPQHFPFQRQLCPARPRGPYSVRAYPSEACPDPPCLGSRKRVHLPPGKEGASQ